VVAQSVFPALERRNNEKFNPSWEPMAHACNPSYLGGRDQEYGSLKLAWANSSQDSILKKKKKITRKGLVVEWLKL
jgi:hypothetical protein